MTAPIKTIRIVRQGPAGPQGPIGAAGADGQDGADGADGAAATIAVGAVTTGAAGSDATVTNSGTPSAAELDFTIPRGDTGAQGDAATIEVGTVTTGAAGSSATVTNSGTSLAAIFDFSIPRGDMGVQGPPGADGADGDPGPLAADVTTEDITGTTYTVVSGDLGKRKRATNAGAVTITLPNSMEQGFSILVCQAGAGQVSLSPASGATLHNRAGYSKTAGQWSEVSLTVDSNAGGTAAVWVLSGDVGQ
jgi:hypothetical protein